MTTFNVRINDEELVKKFQIKIIQKYGAYRGNVSKGFIEAVKDWVEKETED